MEFHINHPILFLIVGLLVAVVLGQSIFFLIKALKRSKALGMDQKKISKTIGTAAIFTIAPAVAIVISIITLSKNLGLPLPWLRLSVVGSMSYETVAANNALSAMGQFLGSSTPLTAQQYLNVVLVMTISIMMGIWLVPAMDGQQTEVTKYFPRTTGLVPVCVLAVSAVTMLICGLLMRIPKLKWLSEYALPISLVVGMAAAIPITALLGQEVV